MKTTRLWARLAALLGGAFVFWATLGVANAAPAEEVPCNPLLEVCPEEGVGLPRDISKFGNEIDSLIQITTVFIAILFVIMVIWMLWACLKHNEKHEAEYDKGSSKKAVTLALSISALIFFVVDGNLFYNSMVDVGDIYWNFEQFYGKKEPEIIRVEINSHQWAWDFRYAGLDAEFGTPDDVVILNEMRVPDDVPVWAQMISTDVIHSFYLPNLRIKFDATPGIINQFWFQTRPHSAEDPIYGRYDIACAQHCGVNHYKMKGTLIVMPREEFDAWLKQASENAARAFDKNDVEAHWGWPWQERSL